MNNRSAVLVHCLAGVSRSVTVTLAYLMHSRGINLEEAFALVRRRKPDISPNFHFLRQLHSFEGSCLGLRTPLSAQSTDSNYSTSHCDTTNCCDSISSPSSCSTASMHPHHHQHHQHHLHHNFHQQLLNQHIHQGQSDYLGTGIGVSPDSGIEFDRWTPADGTPK